jgi:superfamily I DNA and/or RNA helicase
MSSPGEHFERLQRLVALEESAEREELQQMLTQLSPAERELRGQALLDLELDELHYSPAEHVLLTFTRERHAPLPLFSLEVGDVVIIFPSSGRNAEFPTATVYEKTDRTITVALSKDPPAWLEEESRLHLHKSVNRLTYESTYQALDRVRNAHGERIAQLRDASFGLRAPMIEPVDADEIEWLDEGLNASQRRAVQTALSATEVALVHGPPGTGKTRALIEIIRQHVARERSVFACAPSNTACDNLLEQLVGHGVNAVRLGHPARITTTLREHTLDFKVALHPVRRGLAQTQRELDQLLSRQQRYRTRRSPSRDAEREVAGRIRELRQQVRELDREAFARVMREARVFVGTPVSIQNRALRGIHFDLVVLDEASQATEPLSWIPVLKADKVVMAGDHCQLPPTVRNPDAERGGLGISLFERWHARLDGRSRVLLEQQYRMHERIMGFSSEVFYEGRLVADDSVHAHTLADLPGVRRTPDTTTPLLYIDTAGKGYEDRLEPGSESRYNPEEAALVLQEVRMLLEAGVPPGDIAIICPYSAQVRWLAGKLPRPEIHIDSVDGFQGRENEVVIVSLVRSNLEGELGFLGDTRRMNVAMTRARRKLIVIGDSATLANLEFYQRFIRYAERVGAYVSAWERAPD